MALIQVTPERMSQTSKEIDGQLEQWRAAVDRIYKLNEEMDAMWDGMANDAFNAAFNGDRPKFESLSRLMTEYSDGIKQAAARYLEGENEVKGIVTRGRK